MKKNVYLLQLEAYAQESGEKINKVRKQCFLYT